VAFELARLGYDVTVLTAIPDYPQGKYYDGYGIFKRRTEHVNGVKIIRGFIVSRRDGSRIRLMLSYISFLLSSITISLYLAVFKRYDRILVHETSPVMIGIPAVIIKKLRKTPVYFWVLDLWPESLQAAGNVHNNIILGVFKKLVTWLYENSDKILISSKGFKRSIMEKGNFGDKIVFFPNWADRILENTVVPNMIELPKGFVVMFTGNIGEAQDFDHIMACTLLLKSNKDIQFVFVGDGRKRQWVVHYIESHGLQDTVHSVGRFPPESMPYFWRNADVLLMALKDEQIFNLTVPAKLQAYMSASKPIVAMINGEGARLIDEAKCGMTVNASDAENLSKTILLMSKMKTDDLNEMGRNGKAYQQAHFNLDQSIKHLLKEME